MWWSPQLADTIPLAKKFVEAFKAKYGGRTPEWFQALGYETARALFVAIQQAGTTDREAVRAKLPALKIESLLPGGTLEFPADKGGQVAEPVRRPAEPARRHLADHLPEGRRQGGRHRAQSALHAVTGHVAAASTWSSPRCCSPGCTRRWRTGWG